MVGFRHIDRPCGTSLHPHSAITLDMASSLAMRVHSRTDDLNRFRAAMPSEVSMPLSPQ
jgi:hypothetical protein